jgi:diguanylate cyclase (GGDEF)-like protein
VKIYTFALVFNLIFGLIAVVLSLGFYTIEREMLLQMVADSLNRSCFQLEEDLHKAMKNGRVHEIQGILDQLPAINHAIANVSISKDGKYIDFSSSRSLQGKLAGADFMPVEQLYDGIINLHYSKFKSNFSYVDDTQKHDATLLILIDEQYVYGSLIKIAWVYGLIIFLLIGTLAWMSYIVVEKLLVTPLERLMLHALTASTVSNDYFIDEFSGLDKKLSHSFLTLRQQQSELQGALDETLYLDGILRTVADINQLLIAVKSVAQLLEKSAVRLAIHPGYTFCWIALENQGKLIIRAYSSDDIPDLSIGMCIADLNNDDVVSQSFIQKKSLIIDHLEQNYAPHLWHSLAKQSGSFIALPLFASMHDEPIGVLGLYAVSVTGFTKKEIEMLEELSADIGFAIRSFEQSEQLQHHLTTDKNTGLPNRVSLTDRLSENFNVTLAIINIDRFSDINDVYGITIGDVVLINYANWLSQQISAMDGISLYKLGGDEFVLLFCKKIELNQCRKFLEQLILSSSRASFSIDGIEILLTISIGYAEGSLRVLEHATAAIKQAKMTRKSIGLYVSASVGKENNVAWYKRIKSAIEESRIVPFFQPIVDNQTRRIIKYEALIRLIEKDGTIITPNAFLGIAKRMRLYGQLTRIMVEKTVHIFKFSKIPVSINLSTEDLLDCELADMIEKLIMHHHLGKIMIFEILESEGIENYTEVSSFVDRFKSLGCRFAIDDFGSGYSNFDHLLKLNVDTLKIDGSLIKNLPHDRNARIFVQHICEFAHEMGISTVAEFVANEEIYLQVNALGIDASQGYFFYEPAATLVESSANQAF